LPENEPAKQPLAPRPSLCEEVEGSIESPFVTVRRR